MATTLKPEPDAAATAPAPLDDHDWEVPNAEIQEYSPRRTRYCICVPVINEGKRIMGQLERMKAAGLPESADVLILDGGSTDGSLEPEFLKAQGVSALLVKKGPGKLSAQLRMGYAYALRRGYEGIVTIDGNGKDSVESIPAFLKDLEEGYDLIQASRYIPGGEAVNTPKIRTLAIKIMHVPVTNLAAGFRYTDTTSGFRGYSRRFLLDPRVKPFRAVFDTYELLAYLSIRAPRLGFKVKESPATRQYPKTGKVPTKISAVRGNLLLVRILLRAARGGYNPGN